MASSSSERYYRRPLWRCPASQAVSTLFALCLASVGMLILWLGDNSNMVGKASWQTASSLASVNFEASDSSRWFGSRRAVSRALGDQSLHGPGEFVSGDPRNPMAPSDQATHGEVRLAVVQCIAGISSYQTAETPRYVVGVLGLRGRLEALRKAGHKNVEQVLLVCNDIDPNQTIWKLPTVRTLYHDCSKITSAVADKDIWRGVFLKMEAFKLVEYTQVLVVDSDVTVLTDLSAMMQSLAAPAMVPWGTWPAHDFNSGVLLIKPSLEMYEASVSATARLEGNKKVRMNRLWTAVRSVNKRDPNVGVGGSDEEARDILAVSSPRGNQEFVTTFLDFAFRQWGPIHPMPNRFNVPHDALRTLWALPGELMNTSSRITKLRQQGLDVQPPPNVVEERYHELMKLAFGWSEVDIGTTRGCIGPAIVHSTLLKVDKASSGCDAVHRLLWEAALWAYEEACKPDTPSSVPPSEDSSSCMEWKCTCQGISDRYGTIPHHWEGIAFYKDHFNGSHHAVLAQKAREFWLENGCSTVPNATASPQMWTGVPGIGSLWCSKMTADFLASAVARTCKVDGAWSRHSRRRVLHKLPRAPYCDPNATAKTFQRVLSYNEK